MRPKGLEKYGLVNPPKPKRRRLIASCEGSTSSGKSDFMFRTGPRPLCCISLDGNLEHILDKYAGEKDIDIKEVCIPPTFDKDKKDDQDRDYKLLVTIQELYMDAVDSDYYRAILIDGGEYLYELARRGILGGGMEFGDAKRTDFAAVNSFMRSFYDAARSRRVNAMFTHQQKAEFKGATATGNMVMEGWKKTPQCSQVHLKFYKEAGVAGVEKFRMVVVKCSFNSELEEFEYKGDEISFKTLGMHVYEGTEESDWT